MTRAVVGALLIICLTAYGVEGFCGTARSVRQKLNVPAASFRPNFSTSSSASRLSLAKKTPPPPPVPEQKAEGGVEPKYLAALGVFIAACIFDFYRMHGGVAIWDQGYIP